LSRFISLIPLIWLLVMMAATLALNRQIEWIVLDNNRGRNSAISSKVIYESQSLGWTKV
jgi:hypothetical protein